jgi:hypothetical protein
MDFFSQSMALNGHFTPDRWYDVRCSPEKTKKVTSVSGVVVVEELTLRVDFQDFHSNKPAHREQNHLLDKPMVGEFNVQNFKYVHA